MIVIDNDAALGRALQMPIDPRLKDLLQRRRGILDEFELPFEEMGKFIVVQPVDRLDDIETALGFSIRHGRFACCSIEGASFIPAWEWVLVHHHCYEVAFVLSDAGFCIVMFVQNLPGVDADLMAMLTAFTA